MSEDTYTDLDDETIVLAVISSTIFCWNKYAYDYISEVDNHFYVPKEREDRLDDIARDIIVKLDEFLDISKIQKRIQKGEQS
jgi:hypothetical protein